MSNEEKQIKPPQMSIEYRIDANSLSGGTFENIPKNAFGAHIRAIFPVVGANGDFIYSGTSYDLYVGVEFEIQEFMDKLVKSLENQMENNGVIDIEMDFLKVEIRDYKSAGIKRVVSTKFGVLPLKDNDATFSTQEEMALAITKINQTFKSVNFSVQNSEVQSMHR